jgi:hypothetical protein
MLITLEQVNQLRHLANAAGDGDGEGVLIEMLEALIPFQSPVVAGVISEFLANYNRPIPPDITLQEDTNNDRPDYGPGPGSAYPG